MTEPRVTISVPTVPFPGPTRNDAYFFRTVARNLRENYHPGGSNVRETVAELLCRVANELDKADQ